MKDDIRNIIDIEGIIKGANNLDIFSKIPPKGSFVKLIPIEFLEQGVKVLIDGKLFIAFIDGKISLKEEIIAIVTNTKPFSLQLHLDEFPKLSESYIVDQVIKIFDLPNKDSLRDTIHKVVQEDFVIIKSNILTLDELRKYIKVNGLELSLLMTLVWNYSSKSKILIEDLYENLFDIKFEDVCENIFNSIKELIFSEIPQFLRQHIISNFIYESNSKSSTALVGKEEVMYKLIRLFHDYTGKISSSDLVTTDKLIESGVKYILQKAILKSYDFFPDFVIVNHKGELSLIKYNIKKVYLGKDQLSYKVIFKHDDLPFELKAIIRNNLLLGNMKIEKKLTNTNEIHSLQTNLYEKWGFHSDININDEREKEHIISKRKTNLNKLVS